MGFKINSKLNEDTLTYSISIIYKYVIIVILKTVLRHKKG